MARGSINVFVAVPFAIGDVREVVENLVKRTPGFAVLDWTEQLRTGASLARAVLEQVQSADLVIVDVSTANANVTSEAGMGFALGKPVLVTVRQGRPVPHHFAGFQWLEYSDLLDLEEKLGNLLSRFKTSPRDEFAPKPPGELPKAPRKLRMTDMPGEPATRVFVGGNYRDQFAILLEIVNSVNTTRPWTAVFANDYDMPRDRTRQESLRLLHMCDYAIFDVTSDGGQLVEVENAGQYGVDFLLVYNTMDIHAPSHASSMLPRGQEALPYAGLSELRDIVSEWLRKKGS